MKKLINKILNKVPKKEIDRESLEMICNNPPDNLSGFCGIEYGNVNRRSY